MVMIFYLPLEKRLMTEAELLEMRHFLAQMCVRKSAFNEYLVLNSLDYAVGLSNSILFIWIGDYTIEYCITSFEKNEY